MSEELGIGANIHWTGKLRRDEALKVTQQSHVLVISSVYDLTSTVLVEALANGLPVICPDHCGFQDAIDESCGIKAPAGRPSELIEHLAAAVTRLSNEDTRYFLAVGAVRRSKRYLWEHKSSCVDLIYRNKVAGASLSQHA